MASSVDCNTEGDALSAWKANLADPSNLLQSGAPTLVNLCTWFQATCSSNNSVGRVYVPSFRTLLFFRSLPFTFW
ncbi:hypothetical protein NC653_009429 [Populus alba x Populus x berolinensis]|uniref:Leucine-rich repeat-containing N-terminal plant-type domain-containing protein n=1 Tax=Populus alba x Populus x berolinensis TaxID=444605 RepID=A0AAD6WAD0_9ROSI|nr:hypothetical protein NC653_009429 [Populus alba x Populus x berolinensis]